ncbi:MAG TPA: UbiA family prenyltransferase [Flavobacteriaceae bacterium]|nr:UbiA family prenyltransferase [Flavobacteriaceae bacterium]MCB9214120.1 UbiA family prenyltransferase [Alteromonas sp.]HPF11539.1 UbiA family prenyltransferase [Flavobacteriaceae bacterium]HQU21072.1 UbiA family prenyltransferase [Flavobacteriaceae bacterium]HQU65224.1 UbiA family prenyltransferase [Flavobacteriaceae bacterium]
MKISRPGLWFPTVWIYVVPFSFENRFWESWLFWLGFFFVTFPLNYLVYGLNDYNDVKADAVNPRKGNYLFGAKYSEKDLSSVPKRIVWLVLPFVVFFSWYSGWTMLGLLAFMIGVNVLYNFKPFRLKERPPFEIVIQVGYVFVAFFSTELNGLQQIPWQTVLYLSLFAFQAHIAGEIMDLEPDRLAGKRTTATLLGRQKTKGVMLVLLLLEVYLLYFWFQDAVLAGFLAVFSGWLVLDLFFIFKGKPYTLWQMKLFGWAMNGVAFASMLWVLYSGKLMHPVF